jgi:hypothetical protein
MRIKNKQRFRGDKHLRHEFTITMHRVDIKQSINKGAMMALSRSPETTAFSVGNYPLSIFSDI